MKMNDSYFTKAVEIITTHTSSTTLSFNVPVSDNYSNVYPIVLHKATPGLIEALIRNGYNVGVCAKGTYIEKF